MAPKPAAFHPCGYCLRPDRAAFEAAMAAGGSVRAVAREYGLSHASLHRHWKHAKDRQAEVKALEMPPAPEGDTPIHRALRELQATHETTLERYGQANVRETAALHLQLRRDLELRARLEAQVQPDTRPAGERLWDNPDFREAMGAVVEILRRHPEALREVVDAIGDDGSVKVARERTS